MFEAKQLCGLVLNVLHLMSCASIVDLFINANLSRWDRKSRSKISPCRSEQERRVWCDLHLNDYIADIAQRLMNCIHSIAAARG
jgi:hypothetical protein